MKVVKFFLLVLILSGCSGSKVLPRYDAIQYSPFGAQIKAKDSYGNGLKGELIAASDSGIWVLRNYHASKAVSRGLSFNQEIRIVEVDSGNFYFLAMKDVNSYQIKYARSRKYTNFMALIPITFGHGIISAISLPVNFIITGSVAIAGSRAYRYDEMNLDRENLFQFSRYPLGLPEGLNTKELANRAFETPLSLPKENARTNHTSNPNPSKPAKRGSLE